MIGHPPGPAPFHRGDEAGSAVVSALAVGLIIATTLLMVATRTMAAGDAARAAVERARVTSASEYGIAVARAHIEDGMRTGSLGRGVGVDRMLDAAAPEDIGGAASLSVRLLAESGSEHFEVRSTATVGPITSTVEATLRPFMTSDFLLLTAFEVVDPALLQRPRADCMAVRGDPDRRADCLGTAIDSGVFDGPVHSNDALRVIGGHRLGSSVTTSHLVADADGQVGPDLWDGSDADPATLGPHGLHHRVDVNLPLRVTDVLAGRAVTCRLRGPTLLRFDGHLVRIMSPRSVPRPADPIVGLGALGCMGVDRSALIGPTSVALPDGAIIEIVRDDVGDCADHPLGIGLTEDAERDWWCGGADAFVWGEYAATRTVLAHDSIQIVWDLVPPSGPLLASPPTMGLVAGDSIVLRRPVTAPVRRVAPYGRNVAFAGPGVAPFGAYPDDAPNAAAMAWDAPTIVAALVALRGGVGIQNPFLGETHPGAVRIEGSVAGRFRGLFAWEHRSTTGAVVGTTGYAVELSYDPRLVEAPPPAMPLTDHGAVRILALRYRAPG